jgi:hypothetical protein
VRGELPEAFWLRDAFGAYTATDHAFMSTSTDENVCKGFLSNKVWVTWRGVC